jgi:ferric-dicitrate binding protein FerR (iron transport regulator)
MIANIQHWTELIARRLSGNIREEDSRILDAWIARDPEHREYYDQLCRLWSVTGSNQTPEQKLAQPQKKFQVPQLQVAKPVVSPMLRRTISIAAAVTLLIVLTIALVVNRTSDGGKMVVQATGDLPQEVVLPDQSRVFLRKGSSLRSVYSGQSSISKH